MTIFAFLGRAMRRALSWRLLVVSPIVLALAAAATLFPLVRFLGELFDHSPRWRELTASLDSSALAAVAKALMTPASAGLAPAVQTSLLLGVLFAPFLAGAALVVAEAEVPPKLRGLLSGAAGYYPRLLRMQLVALIPLGVAFLLSGLVFGWAGRVAERATSDAATHTSGRLSWAIAIIVVVIAQLVVDAGRARFAAEPTRRSALFAFGAGVKLVVKRPVQALALAVSATAVALLIAAVVLVLRQQLTQASGAGILLAFVLAQLAVAAIAWGHAAKLAGLVELARGLATGRGAAPGPKRKQVAPVEPAAAPAAVPASELRSGSPAAASEVAASEARPEVAATAAPLEPASSAAAADGTTTAADPGAPAASE